MGVIPAIDIYEKGKDIIIVETTLAGIDPEKVEISIENDVLTLQGKMEKKTECRRQKLLPKRNQYW